MGGIPSNYTVDMSLDLVSPVELAGIPSSYQLDITSLPKIQIGLDPITINPLSLSLQITQIPSVRAHVPANFVAGFSIFGFQLASIQLCGEAQVIRNPMFRICASRVGPRYSLRRRLPRLIIP